MSETINITVKGIDKQQQRFSKISNQAMANKISGRLIAMGNQIRSEVEQNITATAKNEPSNGGLRSGGVIVRANGKYHRSIVDTTRNRSNRPYGHYVNAGENFNEHNKGFIDRAAQGKQKLLQQQINQVIKEALR